MGNNAQNQTGIRLRQVAEQLYDGNKSELARSLGMKPASFSKYVQGNRRPGASILERLSRLGVNTNWILTGEGSLLRSEEDPSPAPVPIKPPPHGAAPSKVEGPDGPLYRVPLLRMTIDEAGSPHLEDVDTLEWLSEPRIRNMYGVPPEQLAGFRISGNAMVDTIRPGDRVRCVLWQGESLSEGCIYLIQTPSGATVRRLKLTGHNKRLTADNEDISDLEVNREEWDETFRPVARVLEVIRSL